MSSRDGSSTHAAGSLCFLHRLDWRRRAPQRSSPSHCATHWQQPRSDRAGRAACSLAQISEPQAPAQRARGVAAAAAALPPCQSPCSRKWDGCQDFNGDTKLRLLRPIVGASMFAILFQVVLFGTLLLLRQRGYLKMITRQPSTEHSMSKIKLYTTTTNYSCYC